MRSSSFRRAMSAFICAVMLFAPPLVSAADYRTPGGYILRRSRERSVTAGVTLHRYSFYKLRDPLPVLTQRLIVLNVEPAENPRLYWANALPEKGVHSLQKTSLNARPLTRTKGVKGLAAFNGDFFDVVAGGPLGQNMSEGRWITAGEFGGHPALGFTENGLPVLADPQMRLTLNVFRDGEKILSNVPIDALNAMRADADSATTGPMNALVQRRDNRLVLYTRDFGSSTRQKDGGFEVRFQTADTVRSGETMSGTVDSVFPPGTDTYESENHWRGARIPKGASVLSSAPENPVLQSLRPGDRVEISCAVAPEWAEVVTATGGGRPDGGPMLIWRGAPVPDDTTVDDYEYFYGRHARTVFARRRDGSYFFLSAPQGQDAKSDGIALSDLKDMLLWLGAEDALNLDGGPSATFCLPRGKQFFPSADYRSAERERETRVGNSLVLLEKAE